MVLFLFVIMLLNLDDEQGLEHFDLRRGFAFILGLALIAELMYVFSGMGAQSVSADKVFAYGKVEPIGQMLMTEFLFPFEMISVVLLVALVGAIVIARKHIHSEA
jgi:NADH-quinone oxidoreductase subunit J